MAEKLKFKPVITRIKLNPEQAVLSCTCYSARKMSTATVTTRTRTTCKLGSIVTSKTTGNYYYAAGTVSS